MPYTIPTTPAGIRSEAAAASKRGLTALEYRKLRLAGRYYCPVCNDWLTEDDFRKDASKASGIGGVCKGCDASRRKIDPEKRRQRNERRAALVAELAELRDDPRLDSSEHLNARAEELRNTPEALLDGTVMHEEHARRLAGEGGGQ